MIKRDSRKLAKLLESNMLKKVRVLTKEDRANRELILIRRQLIERRSDVTDKEHIATACILITVVHPAS